MKTLTLKPLYLEIWFSGHCTWGCCLICRGSAQHDADCDIHLAVHVQLTVWQISTATAGRNRKCADSECAHLSLWHCWQSGKPIVSRTTHEVHVRILFPVNHSRQFTSAYWGQWAIRCKICNWWCFLNASCVRTRDEFFWWSLFRFCRAWLYVGPHWAFQLSSLN